MEPMRSWAAEVVGPYGAEGRRSAIDGTRERDRRSSVPHTNSRPNEVGSSWKGKTTPSVDLTPLAAADDLMGLF